jgi:DNA-binding FadR family transcriptional regulator
MSIDTRQYTLVDQVEDHLLSFFKDHDLQCGDPIPNEVTLSKELGVARSVVREALSRLRMMGLVYSRPRRGMVLTEPSILNSMKRVIDPRIMSESTLMDILGFRIALEEGISSDIFRYITPKDITELEEIVQMGIASENNEYSLVDEFTFHSKLYKVTGNRTIAQFQELIHPVLTYVKQHFRDYLQPINIEMERNGTLVSHSDLLECIMMNDLPGYVKAINRHFEVYRIFTNKRRNEISAL